ncbi:hypothetical protein DRO49_02775 [Candidatus Bathyarchaeota archaeon]|nr:MAG: hypothetical protein DRO49_02775 [Candidatus Bathyarchaeota archaeon]
MRSEGKVMKMVCCGSAAARTGRKLDAKRIGALRVVNTIRSISRTHRTQRARERRITRINVGRIRVLQAAEVSLEDFVNKHLALIDFLNDKGEKGECVTYDEIVEFVGSEELADKHIQCLEIEEAFVNALPDVYCSLTAVIKRKEEMLPE